MSQTDDMDDAILIYGVHALDALARRALATRLVAESVTIDDVELLGDHVAASTNVSARPDALLAILTDPKARDDYLPQLRRQRVLRADRGAKDQRFGDKPTAVAPLAGEDAKKWEHDRACRIAYCRVRADRRSVAAVADELGVPAADVPAMVERGAALQASPIISPKSGKACRQVDRDDQEHAARVKRFVEACKANRRRNEHRALEIEGRKEKP